MRKTIALLFVALTAAQAQTADAHAALLKTISDLIPKIDAEIKKVTTQWEDAHSEQLALARSSEAIVKAPYNADNRDELRGMLKKESTLIELMKSLTREIHRFENLRKLASMVPECQATFLSTVDKKTSDLTVRESTLVTDCKAVGLYAEYAEYPTPADMDKGESK